MEKFASYGFNKSHAAAYSLISYQTAYLKAHYPVEFMCAVMDLDIINTDKLAFFVAECRSTGMEILKPDINLSNADFKVEDNKIRYALGAVKGVGSSYMQGIVAEREKNGPFKNISDFCHRVDIKNVNRKQMYQLVKAGAFDCLEKNRAMLCENVDVMVSNIFASSETKKSEQQSLFGSEELCSKIKFKEVPDWSNLEKLRHEAEAIGFYLSAHPLDIYAESAKKLGVKSCTDVMRNLKAGDSIKANIAVCVENFRKRIGKSGKPYAFVGFSDASGTIEAFLFADGLAKYENILASDEPFLVKITIDKQTEDTAPRVMINSVKKLDEAITEQAKGLIITVTDVSAVRQLKEILQADRKGANKIYIIPDIPDWDLRFELPDGYAFYDTAIITKIRSVAGVSDVKEI